MTTRIMSANEPDYVFPPALVGVVRERLPRTSTGLAEVSDDQLAQLLTTVFFAGLETYEGEHEPIGVAFFGRNAGDFFMVGGATAGTLPLYQWKILRFASPRPFLSRELVKLAVAGADRRIYSAVGVLDNGSLAITGLAREGVSAGPDQFVKVIASRPGCLSIRSGRELVIAYERGVILAAGQETAFAAGPVHEALTAIAHGAGVDEDVVPHYLHAVGFLVHEIVAHGHGGILIVSADEQPSVADLTPYRMRGDSSLAALLRLAWRSGHAKAAEQTPFSQLLRTGFLAEADRVVEELGRLTAIDGAVLLNRDLALVAFGVILPVGQPVVIAAADAPDDGRRRVVDFSTRGTRHRASANYAAEHPGSVVFVASEDGQVSCMVRAQPDEPVRLWQLAAETARKPMSAV